MRKPRPKPLPLPVDATTPPKIVSAADADVNGLVTKVKGITLAANTTAE